MRPARCMHNVHHVQNGNSTCILLLNIASTKYYCLGEDVPESLKLHGLSNFRCTCTSACTYIIIYYYYFNIIACNWHTVVGNRRQR